MNTTGEYSNRHARPTNARIIMETIDGWRTDDSKLPILVENIDRWDEQSARSAAAVVDLDQWAWLMPENKAVVEHAITTAQSMLDARYGTVPQWAIPRKLRKA